jgi:uncharacterized protein YkwD
MSLNLIDALLLLVILLGVAGGVRLGFLAGAGRLITVAAGLTLAFMGYRYPAGVLELRAAWLGVWIAPLCFLGTYLIADLVLGAIIRWMVNAVPREVHAHAGNRAMGAVPGFAIGLVHAIVVAVILSTLPLSDRLTEMTRESEITARLAEPGEWIEARFAPIFDPAVRRTMQALTVPPDSRGSIKLPFRVENARNRPDLEAAMLELVNAERAKQGLKPLQADAEIAEVARAHGRDMFARGYFSHVTPEKKDLSERLRQGKVRFLVAGENLAHAPTLARAHQGLMNSPGHRANILRPEFGRLGIAVLDGGKYGLMVTQNFRN